MALALATRAPRREHHARLFLRSCRMIDRINLAIVIGVVLVAALGAILAYQVTLYTARKNQRGMSTRQRLRKQHWAIRLDNAAKSRSRAKNRAAEKRALLKRRRSR